MFKSINSDGQYSGGQASASSSGHGVASSGHKHQGSSHQGSSRISVFSVVSRPAWSFLQKHLPGWVIDDLKQSLVDEDVFFGQLGELMSVSQHSAEHVACVSYQPYIAVGESTLNWLDWLREMGIENYADKDRQHSQIGEFSNIRKLYSRILSSADREMESNHVLAGNTCSGEAVGSPLKRERTGKSLWGGGNSESAQSWMSNALLGKEWMVTGDHCAQTVCGTKAPVVKTTRLLVQCASRPSKLGESAGRSSDKEKPNDNGSLHTSQPGPLQSSQVPGITCHVYGAGVATSCSGVAVLTPDQDNGYSSLEEEHTINRLSMVKVISEQDWQKAAAFSKGCAVLMIKTEGEGSECRADEESTTVTAKDLLVRTEETEHTDSDGGPEDEAGASAQEGSPATAIVSRAPLCQNKAIAYIMGAACSDDDSQSDDDDDEFSEDDGGFDSEGSSDLSDSEESAGSENEADLETEHLWDSLRRSRDPYNPRNFTACIHTSVAVPLSSAPASHQGPPSPSQAPSPLSLLAASSPGLSSSPPQNQDSWDDSASEADEAESLHLWNSFFPDSDPYSPLNFQAPLRTREPPKAVPRTKGHVKKGSPRSAWCKAPASPPQYSKEDAEERLDSGFSEIVACTVATASTRVIVKKVRFCDNLEEIWASDEDEDRRGPWEELARDRWRFQRRCQEVEQSIAYCLRPQHRSLAQQRLTLSCTQDS